MLLIITGFFLLCYAFLFGYYYYHWKQLKEYKDQEINPLIFVSVVIAARNEEENIGQLLSLLQNQTYPQAHYEIIVVDDYSTDGTKEMVQSFLSDRVKLINPEVAQSLSSKKKAIDAGVKAAKGEFIVITDADCQPSTKWIETVAGFQKSNNAVFIAAPVKFQTFNSLLGIFQSLDFITLQGITAASVQANFHSMCNGANLAYRKEAFFEVGGFEDIDKVASGDDMLLMYKIWKKRPKGIAYLKSREAIIETKPMMSWKTFFQQRIRWSSKAAYYDDYRVMLVLMFVYLLNCLFFVLLFAAIFNSSYWPIFLGYFVAKTLIELPFVASVASFYGERKLVLYFPFLQPLHIAYVVLIGMVSQLGKYEWKGRKTK